MTTKIPFDILGIKQRGFISKEINHSFSKSSYLRCVTNELMLTNPGSATELKIRGSVDSLQIACLGA